MAQKDDETLEKCYRSELEEEFAAVFAKLLVKFNLEDQVFFNEESSTQQDN